MDLQIGLDKISSELERIYDSNEVVGVRVRPGSGGNILIPVLISGNAQLDTQINTEINNLVNLLQEIRPARIFILKIRSAVFEATAAVNALCNKLNEEEYVCSERIEINAPVHALRSVLSVLRVNFLPGQGSTVVAFDGGVPREWFEQLVQICDELVIDTEKFAHRTELFSFLVNVKSTVVDIRWLALSTWREVIRTVFGSVELRSRLSELENIDIKISGAGAPPLLWGIDTILMAGWLIDRLGLDIIRSDGKAITLRPASKQYGSRGKDSQAASLTMRFYRGVTDDSARITSISFCIGSDIVVALTAGPGAKLVEATIKRGAAVISRYSHPRGADGAVELLQHFYLVGESIANYKRALRIAMGLR